MAFGGGGRATSESFWPAPPEHKSLQRMTNKTKFPSYKKVTANKTKVPSPVQKSTVRKANVKNPTVTVACLPVIVDEPKEKPVWGSKGTWLGRRPPKDPARLAIFLKKKADWQEQRRKMS